MNIRQYIKDNFKDDDTSSIKESIEKSLEENDEVTLPGLGVFFEILWQNINEKEKEKILDIIKNNI